MAKWIFRIIFWCSITNESRWNHFQFQIEREKKSDLFVCRIVIKWSRSHSIVSIIAAIDVQSNENDLNWMKKADNTNNRFTRYRMKQSKAEKSNGSKWDKSENGMDSFDHFKWAPLLLPLLPSLRRIKVTTDDWLYWMSQSRFNFSLNELTIARLHLTQKKNAKGIPSIVQHLIMFDILSLLKASQFTMFHQRQRSYLIHGYDWIVNQWEYNSIKQNISTCQCDMAFILATRVCT